MSVAARLRAVAEEVRRATAGPGPGLDASGGSPSGWAPGVGGPGVDGSSIRDPEVRDPDFPHALSPETFDLRELAEAVLEVMPELLRIQGVE